MLICFENRRKPQRFKAHGSQGHPFFVPNVSILKPPYPSDPEKREKRGVATRLSQVLGDNVLV